jgi:hypothetical protein
VVGAATGNRNVGNDQFAAAAFKNWRLAAVANSHLTRPLFASILREIEALPLRAQWTRQQDATNFEGGGELREACLRSRSEMEHIVTFWFWGRLCRTRPVLWLRNDCRKGSKQRHLVVDFPHRPSKNGTQGYTIHQD